MKTVALLVMSLGSLLLTTGGCADPGYTAHERNQLIARNWSYDLLQTTDDFDSILMLRPNSKMTIWNVMQGPGPY